MTQLVNLTEPKKGTRYRYYNLPSAKPNHPLGRLPALEIEAAVKTHLINYIEEGRQSGIYTQEPDTSLPSIINILKHGTPHEQCALALKLIEKVQIYEGGMEVWVHKKALSPTGDTTDSATHKLVIKADIKRQVNGAKILVPAGSQVLQAPDQTLIQLIAKAQLWSSDLESGNFTTMAELAGNNDVNKKDLGKAVRLAYLAPDIITSILEGRQPASLKANALRKMSDLPADWDAQRKVLGFT